MNRYLLTIITGLTVLFACVSLSAQEYENTPVTVSKDKVRINGQVYYSHITLEKQTLYSICKAYNVSVEDIYKHNPSVKENGLKKNSILIIPIVEIPKETAVPGDSLAVRDSVEMPKEKPLKKLFGKNEPALDNSGKKTHTVKWFEDINSIAAKYEISVAAIMKANNLSTKKLTSRMKLIIPEPGEYPDEEIADTMEVPVDSTEVNDTTNKVKDFFEDLFFMPKKEVKLSLVLPFAANGNSGSKQNMDFYSGVLLASYDLAETNDIHTELNVYDIADGKMPSNEDISMSDIVIGPISSSNINELFSLAPDMNALISPLDPKADSLAFKYETMVHVPTPHEVQYNDLVSWIKEDMEIGDRVLFITEKGARQNDAVEAMSAAIDSSGIEYKTLSYSILEGRNVSDNLAYLMTETAVNRVYIASESEAFVNDVVRNLNLMIHKKYNIVLYAASKIRGFGTIEAENFHNTKMHVSTGYYIDYNDSEVKAFLLKYRALFGTEPSQFAFQGYDTAKYFIELCSKYGNNWMKKLDKSKVSMLQSIFDFTQIENGGYVNNGVRRIVYGEDWIVETIR